MTGILNADYDAEIKCIWCGNEWILCKKEVWFNPYICPHCKKEMGMPIIMHGSRNENGIMKEYHKANGYLFSATMGKTKVLKFIELVSEGGGTIRNILPRKFGGWILGVVLEKALPFVGAILQNPPIIRGQ